MPESIQQQLPRAIEKAWNSVAPGLLDRTSSLELADSRVATGEGLNAALALAGTWPDAFSVPCKGAVSGNLFFLFKRSERDLFERSITPDADGLPIPAGRTLITDVLLSASVEIIGEDLTSAGFGTCVYNDLTVNDSPLSSVVREGIYLFTYSLSIEGEAKTQVMVVYAPAESVAVAAPRNESVQPDAPPVTAPAPVPTATRNIARLLDVELDVVVRFGVTNVPLRDIVRLGVGSMVELNRPVDEPVELLVNGRSLARGEVVVIDGYYGVRITEIGSSTERSALL
jgi:flagellar motor switch protein FliN